MDEQKFEKDLEQSFQGNNSKNQISGTENPFETEIKEENKQVQQETEPEEWIEASKNNVLNSNNDLMIRRKINEIDRQLAEYGNYIDKYYDKDGTIVEEEYTAKEAKKLRTKLLLESEKLRNINWADRSYKEWSFKWIASKIWHAFQYVFNPVYRSLLRDAAVLEKRADIDAQYKAFVERKTEKIKEDLDRSDQEKQKISEKENEPKAQEPQKDRPEKIMPEQKENCSVEKQEKFYKETDDLMQNQGMTKEDAICNIVSRFPRNIAFVKDEDLTKNIATKAYQSAMMFREQESKEKGEPFTNKQKWEQTKYLTGKFPQMVLAFDENAQKHMIVSATLRNPKILTYMQPGIADDKYFAERLKTAMEDITKKHVEQGKEIPDFNEKVLKPLLTEYKDLGAVPSFIPHINAVFGKELIVQITGTEIFETELSKTETVEQMEQDQKLSQPEILTENNKEQNAQEDFPGYFSAETPQNFETQVIPEEPPVRWDEQPAFLSAVQDAKDYIRQMTDGQIQNPDIETIKVTVKAVSSNLSLMRYVPDSEKMPEYMDREQLKQKIMDQVCTSVMDTARKTGKQPMEILRSQACKTIRGDTKETEEMKKTLRNKGFELNQRLEKELSIGDEH